LHRLRLTINVCLEGEIHENINANGFLIIAYYGCLFDRRSRFAKEPAALKFNRLASAKESVGGTPTEAVEPAVASFWRDKTTALPKKSRVIRTRNRSGGLNLTGGGGGHKMGARSCGIVRGG